MILFGGASIIVFAKLQLCGWKGIIVSTEFHNLSEALK